LPSARKPATIATATWPCFAPQAGQAARTFCMFALLTMMRLDPAALEAVVTAA
jgi:hypothetical protein